MSRLDRSQYTLKDALDEIALAEAILDGIGADEGVTLWGRIASIKSRLTQRAVDPPSALGGRTDSPNMFTRPQSRTDGTAGN